MFSNKPYLIRAFYDWIVDNKCTPNLVIDATYPRVQVPKDFVENGEITLNVSPQAIRDLKMTNELVEFRASFSGVVHIINAPIKSVLAIYAEENSQGMFFDYEEEDEAEAPSDDASFTPRPETVSKIQEKVRSHLKLVE